MDTNIATRFITDLVNQGILGKEVNGTWTLVKPLMGYAGDIAFHSKEELIQKLVQAFTARYGAQGPGLKAAV